jgi:catechol 2,3-dioxygenase-like lactoylglutathione lyase family enzyme
VIRLRINRVRIVARNIDAQRRFYAEVLGLPTQLDAEGALRVAAGQTELICRPSTEAPFYHIAFNIPENQIEAAAAYVRAKTSLLRSEGEEIFYSNNWHAHNLYFYDADGNVLELIARHNLTESAADSFDPTKILSVSEVGVPVPQADLARVLDECESVLALPCYDCDRVRFNALGGEDGLLIVVAEGRPWFPTDRPAPVLPLEVELTSGLATPVTLTSPWYAIHAK